MLARSWTQELFDANPDWVTIRLGHGFNEATRTSTVWVDIITSDGWHLAADRTAVLPNIPDDVRDQVIQTVPLGHWSEFTRAT